MTKPIHPPRKKFNSTPTNPLQAGIHSYLKTHFSTQPNNHHPSPSSDPDLDSHSLPKRYTLYPPLLLLPPNFFTQSPSWTSFTTHLSPEQLQLLWQAITTAFKGQGITHVALNAPIALLTARGGENRKRSPRGIEPLWGNFGPRRLVNSSASSSLGDGDGDGDGAPTQEDFAAAFWVSTRQNGGIYQTWAPLRTMFSRGNIREKARILGQQPGGYFEGLDGPDGEVAGQDLREVAVADLFVGIGYFAFSYLKRGVGIVWGWEVNGWSVEGLRRGCGENGWGVRVLRVEEGSGECVDEEGGTGEEVFRRLAEQIQTGVGGLELRMVVFWGDNKDALKTIARMREVFEHVEGSRVRSALNVRHVNLGLLPSSRMAWERSVDLLEPSRTGWIHVHENVDMKLEQKADAIVEEFQTHLGYARRASCSHVEQVKTYAPGIMHCVCDIRIDGKCEPNQLDKDSQVNAPS